MHSVSILGYGWLGLALGIHLKKEGMLVIGSTTSKEKQSKLMELELDTVVFSLTPQAQREEKHRLFASEVLVITLPALTRSGEGEFYLAQLQSLKKLIEGSSIEKVLMISSTGIYPEHPMEERYTEESLQEGISPGNPILLQAERFMEEERTYAFTCLRLGGLMGPGRIPGNYVSGKPEVVGHARVNYIHQFDAVRMIAWIIQKGLWDQTFNGVAPYHPRRKEIYEQNVASFGISPPRSYAQFQKGVDRVIDSRKILETGFQFAFPDPLHFEYY